MRTETIVRKMEEYVQDFRAQLEKNDPASINTLMANTEAFFNELSGELPANADFGRGVEQFRGCVERFGDACKLNDVRKASEVLEEMESTVQSLEKMCGV